jgi:DNA segregation ATPase FtsK/SpoIIIE, S-DNA-T family
VPAEVIDPAARGLADQLAPGLAALPPDDTAWRSREFVGAGGSEYLRVGVIAGTSDDPVPAVVPVLGTAGWQVRADSAGTAHQVLQGLVLRLVLASEPFRLRVDAFDPRLAGTMGLLGPVTARYPQIAPRAGHAPAELQQVLSDLVEVSAGRASRMAQLGVHRFQHLAARSRSAPDPHRVVLLLDYPSGVDARAQHDLVRLASTAQRRGLCFLVHHDPSISPADGVRPADLLGHLETFTISGDTADLSRLPGLRVRLDPPFDPTVAARAADLALGLAARAALPTVEFLPTLPPAEHWWQPVRDELSAVIGYADGEPAALRLRSGNPPLPHVLIGGAVGQGKSNLLLVLIHALAAKYSPADLEMYLLDFKHGVEFAVLGPAPGRDHWLPHARVLGVHSDRAFGLAVLRHVSGELARRSAIFKAHGNVTDICQLPAGPDRPPRILLVLDEFQVLLEEDDEIAAEAAKVLEQLVRTGRAYGVHVVLATQTVESMQRLATRRDAIFGQVPYRIALKSTRVDSQSILGTGNTAASELSLRGEAVLNANFGSPGDNQRILVSHADRDDLEQLRRQLWARAEAEGLGRRPRLFHLAEAADLAATAMSQRAATRAAGAGSGSTGSRAAGPPRAWAGLPIAVPESPVAMDVRPEPGAGVLVLGEPAADAVGVITGLAVTLALSAGTSPRFVIIDGLRADSRAAGGTAALIQALRGLGCQVEILDELDAVVSRLLDLRDGVQAGAVEGPTYLLGLGLHGLPRMTTHVENRFESPADVLQEIVRAGPAAGLVTLASWNRLNVCVQQLGAVRVEVATHMFLRHPEDGVRSVCGPLTRWSPGPHRALLWDGLGAEPQVVVPFAPLTAADAEQLIEMMRP